MLEPLLARWRHRRALALLPPGTSILDLGCGQFPVFLSAAPFDRREGIDMLPPNPNTPTAIRIHRQDLNTIQRLPFPQDHFDAITMLATMEHLSSPALVLLLRDVRRVLRPGGRLVFTTPHVAAAPVLRLLTILRLVSREEIDEHQALFTKRSLQSLLSEAGFPPSHVCLSSFQCGLNLCGYAVKATQGQRPRACETPSEPLDCARGELRESKGEGVTAFP